MAAGSHQTVADRTAADHSHFVGSLPAVHSRSVAHYKGRLAAGAVGGAAAAHWGYIHHTDLVDSGPGPG